MSLLFYSECRTALSLKFQNDEYFQECTKNKCIPKDTPKYLRKALERAIKEYQQGVILQKSLLDNFAEKYVIERKTGIRPKQF